MRTPSRRISTRRRSHWSAATSSRSTATSSTSIFNHRCIHAQPLASTCTLSSLPLLPLACAPGLGVAHFGCARRASRCRTTRSSTPSSPPTTRSDVRAVRLRPERWVPRSAGGSVVSLCRSVAVLGLVHSWRELHCTDCTAVQR